MPQCACGGRFLNTRALHAHRNKCSWHLSRARETYERAQQSEQDLERPQKRRNTGLPAEVHSMSEASGATGSSEGPCFPDDLPAFDNAPFPEPDPIGPSPSLHEDAANVSSAPTTRGGRRIRPTWKVRDALPAAPGELDEPQREVPASREGDLRSGAPSARRIVLLLTETMRTAANRFGLKSWYKRRPTQPPRVGIDLNECYAPTADAAVAKISRRPIAEIISPFPNLSSWHFAHHFWLAGDKKSVSDREAMQELITQVDFEPSDLKGVDFKKLDAQLASDESTPWTGARGGWEKSSVTIGVPTGEKSTQASRRAANNARMRAERREHVEDIPAEHPIPGAHFTVDGFWHKNLCSVIKDTLSSDPAARDFVFDPCFLEYQGPHSNGSAERVYGEMYNSEVFVNEDIRLQNSPREPGCDLPRAIAGLMFWSDATHVSQFGQSKVWPNYMYFANQSKYVRARPSAEAAHHVAYFASLPDDIQDFVRGLNKGKAATAQLLTHCRRELFQAAWALLLDTEFMHAYEHGIVIDYYPEKVLIATLRDKGRCPCPRCLVTMDCVPQLGTSEDRAVRETLARKDDAERQLQVSAARDLIYKDGYVVNSEKVDELLKEHSLIPTENTFSERLLRFRVNFFLLLVVDLLHEFELGVWKALFAHLIRILEAHNMELVHELNLRFRLVPAFGRSTIRDFAANVSEMKRMAARDFEDILQHFSVPFRVSKVCCHQTTTTPFFRYSM
ncbi:hypothetical protein B0H21DRAFT_896115 [Amylocystis lapponica]|nr:hypothetical protein B0H21DRAFT_896115 [Amylocystis lapponica]